MKILKTTETPKHKKNMLLEATISGIFQPVRFLADSGAQERLVEITCLVNFVLFFRAQQFLVHLLC